MEELVANPIDEFIAKHTAELKASFVNLKVKLNGIFLFVTRILLLAVKMQENILFCAYEAILQRILFIYCKYLFYLK